MQVFSSFSELLIIFSQHSFNAMLQEYQCPNNKVCRNLGLLEGKAKVFDSHFNELHVCTGVLTTSFHLEELQGT